VVFPLTPTKFDLTKPEEIKRLYSELLEYMKVSLDANCPHCHKTYREGTDFQGRQFAIEALQELVKREA
jgi:hypothetical protein